MKRVYNKARFALIRQVLQEATVRMVCVCVKKVSCLTILSKREQLCLFYR